MVGIGYRKEFAEELLLSSEIFPDFIEVAPENWIGVGGYWKRKFNQALSEYPLFVHGLSLSVGGPDALDYAFLSEIKKFLKETGAKLYSEHLSFAQCDNAHLYDLLPIPFTEEAVHHVSARIREVQEILEQRIAIENVSYYTPVAAEMSEIEFINGVLDQADCDLLLDVNNVYVNSYNHGYNPTEFIDKLPMNRVKYIHMAGHEKIADDFIIDTHGQPIIDPVYQLFFYTMNILGRDVPVLLERDFNIPQMAELQNEIEKLRSIKSDAIKLNNYEYA